MFEWLTPLLIVIVILIKILDSLDLLANSRPQP